MLRTRQKRAGFSLLEVMIALVVLLVALVGAVGGLIAGAQSFHDGQIRQSRMVLVETKIQSLEMSTRGTANGAGLTNVAFTGGSTSQMGTWPPPINSPTTLPENVAIATSPWFVDPTPSVCPVGCQTTGTADLSTGAYFYVSPNGAITHVPTTVVAPSTACNAVPAGVYCREVVVATGFEYTSMASDALWAGALAPFTFWVRVVKSGDTLNQAVVQRDVVF